MSLRYDKEGVFPEYYLRFLPVKILSKGGETCGCLKTPNLSTFRMGPRLMRFFVALDKFSLSSVVTPEVSVKLVSLTVETKKKVWATWVSLGFLEVNCK